MADLYSGAGGGAGTMAMVRGDGSGPKGADSELDVTRYTAKDVLLRLVSYLLPHKGMAAGALIATSVSVILQLYVPILIGEAIDTIMALGSVSLLALVPILLKLAAVVALAGATQWLGGVWTNRLSYATVKDLRDEAFATFGHLPFSFLDAHAHGDLLSRVVNDADAVGDGLLQGSTQLFSGIVTIVGTLAFMFSLSVPVALAVMVLTPLSILVAAAIARLSSKSFADAQRLQGSLLGYAEEMVTNHTLVSAFAREDEAQETFCSLNNELLEAGVKSQFISSLSNPSTRMVNNLTYAAVAVLGCVCVVTGKPSPLSVGEVQSFLAYANQYMKPFNEISGVVTQLQAAFASARRLFALIDALPELPVEHPQALPAPTRGDIRFSHVRFSYEPDKPVIQDVSFHALPGQRFALVGSTGCGKTTLINLLMRFYDCDEGHIEVDGVPIQTINRDELRSAFGMVLQETWLMDGTVRDNIAFGKPGATDEEVVAAAERAHANAFIRQLPEGYDTWVGQDGSTLSEGQRQLLCIARVMLADSAILLLDEATSSIDTRTEREVQDAFDSMMQGRTSLVVAHRLSTIRHADCILVMDAGRIIERGTHEELLAAQGAYAKLYQSQWVDAPKAQ